MLAPNPEIRTDQHIELSMSTRPGGMQLLKGQIALVAAFALAILLRAIA